MFRSLIHIEQWENKRWEKILFMLQIFWFCFFYLHANHLFLFDTGHFLVIVHAIPTVVLQIGKTDKQKKQINSVQYNECNL